MYCDNCAAEPASYDHLDLSQGEAVFKRLCKRCGDVERAQWDAERQRRPPRVAPLIQDLLSKRHAA